MAQPQGIDSALTPARSPSTYKGYKGSIVIGGSNAESPHDTGEACCRRCARPGVLRRRQTFSMLPLIRLAGTLALPG